MIVAAQNLSIFGGLPPEPFISLFPSTDAFYSERYTKLIAKVEAQGGVSLSEAIFAAAQMNAWRDATALATARSAQLGLSILREMLGKVAWTEGKGQALVQKGLWAPVSFQVSASPADIRGALVNAGLELALSAIQGIPWVGGLIKAAIGVGRLLRMAFDRPDKQEPPVYFPWETYSKDLDEDLVRVLTEQLAGLVDYTRVFKPPATPQPWQLLPGTRNGKPVDGGQVFAPLNANKRIDYSDGLGAMPGTMRVAGWIQRVLWRPGSRPAKHQRFYRDYLSAEIPWGSMTTDTGDYFPALAQAAAGLWQQFQKIGTPMMYQVAPGPIKAAWELWFDFMFASAFGRYSVDASSGELVAPYIAVYREHSKGDGPNWRLGITGLERPMPAPFVTPAIFTNGPATEDTRTRCLYVQKGGKDYEGTDYRSYAYTDLKGFTAITEDRRWFAVKAGMSACGRPPAELCPDDLLPEGFVCVPWPTGTELLSGYGRPDAKIIGPACDRLYELQRRCLESTLACAYVRYEDNKGGQRFGAFVDEPLAKRCHELRKILLKHKARFQLRLEDVDPIDPEFGQELRASGVTNTPAQMGPGIGAGGGGVVEEDDTPLPKPLPAALGVPFDNLPPQTYSLLWGPN
jgi:hypothetical protein